MRVTQLALLAPKSFPWAVNSLLLHEEHEDVTAEGSGNYGHQWT